MCINVFYFFKFFPNGIPPNQTWWLCIFCLLLLQYPDGWSAQSRFPSHMHPREQIVALTFSFSSPLLKLSLTVLSLLQIPHFGDHHHNLPLPSLLPENPFCHLVSLGLRTTHSNILSSIWLLVWLLVTHPLLYTIFQYPFFLLSHPPLFPLRVSLRPPTPVADCHAIVPSSSL